MRQKPRGCSALEAAHLFHALHSLLYGGFKLINILMALSAGKLLRPYIMLILYLYRRFLLLEEETEESFVK